MKRQHDQNTGLRQDTASTQRENHSGSRRGSPGTSPRPPPPFPYRRYPSLSDDGQPYFPGLRWPRRSAQRNDAANPSDQGDRASVPVIPAVVLLVIVAIIALLVVTA